MGEKIYRKGGKAPVVTISLLFCPTQRCETSDTVKVTESQKCPFHPCCTGNLMLCANQWRPAL